MNTGVSLNLSLSACSEELRPIGRDECVAFSFTLLLGQKVLVSLAVDDTSTSYSLVWIKDPQSVERQVTFSYV